MLPRFSRLPAKIVASVGRQASSLSRTTPAVHLQGRPEAYARSQACHGTSPSDWRTICLSSSRRLKLNQATTCCVSNCFGPADYVQLGEDAFHVRLHGSLTNKQC